MSSHPIKRQAIMKHINADNQPDVVKQFLLSLDIHAGSIVEVGGRTMHISEHDPVLIASVQEAYNNRDAGRPLVDVAASIRRDMGFQGQQ
jgi:hypothetical protein